MTDFKTKLEAYKQNIVVPPDTFLLGNKTICKLAGVTFGDRQKYLKLVDDNTPLRLYRDRKNIYDFYAVGVEAFIGEEWQDLGFIPKEINKDVCNIIDTGGSLQVDLWKKLGEKIIFTKV